MVRLLVHVEGETEETFSNEALRPHLLTAGYQSVSARIIGNARQRVRRGGIRGWPEVMRDIVRHLQRDPGCAATTMVDYYGLPQSGVKAWPGRAHAATVDFAKKADAIESALLAEVMQEMGDGFDQRRFVPFVVIHEFEGLLFSDCDAFARGLGQPKLANKLKSIREQFATPEEIDDSPRTSPSKRIELLVPEYQKALFGNLAALEIGLSRIRDACPHFEEWLTKLETLAAI
jgi:hypothetical protein